MPVRKLFDEDFECIVAMRERGEKYGRIARAIGCSSSAVSWHCLRLAVEPPNPPKPFPEIRGPLVTMRNGFEVRRYTPADDARLLELEAEGKTVAQIARVLGRRHNSVCGRLMTLARREARMEGARG